MNSRRVDFLVIGSGLAGLAFALKAARFGKVLISTKASELSSTNTAMAQGGIAAVMGDDDSFDRHVQDTLNAGAGLCREDVVRRVVEQGPSRIQDLVEWGVQFDIADAAGFALTREGGHSTRRILHFADQTGQEIHTRLLQKVLSHPDIEVLENHFAIDLITERGQHPLSVEPDRAIGCYLLNQTSGKVSAVLARATILATGGAGKVYLYTSNWSGATGDGIAMAYRAGARVANLEFMQFHPTCLYHPQARNFLITEAMRGEGGELINSRGEAFMKRYHPMGSLAPRDIVARSIDAEMKKSGEPSVFLDVRRMGTEFIERRFPGVTQACRKLGIDPATQAIPVVPAAHYLCGGVLTDFNGRTDVAGLFAIGETACTGLHGANRLASNSLLECLVFAHNAAEFLSQHMSELPLPEGPIPLRPHFEQENSDELIVVSHMWDEIRRLMWNYVGIVRSNRRLERAQHRLQNIQSEIAEYYAHFRTHRDIEELRNIALIAELSIRCAQSRQESRGIHYNLDYPVENQGVGLDTIL